VVTKLYALNRESSQAASLDDTALVITHKSQRSYLYHLPSLNCAAHLKYPTALSEHLLIKDAPEGALLITIFEREKAKHPEDQPRYSHELWAWSVKHQPGEPEDTADPPLLTPLIFKEHQAPIMGVNALADHHFISWDEAGEAIVWEVKKHRKAQSLKVKQHLSLIAILFGDQEEGALDERSARKIKLKVSPDGRRVIVWTDTHVGLLSSTARGYKLKDRRLKLTHKHISEAHFVSDHLIFLCERHVGISLYDVSGRRASAKYTLDESPFLDIARFQVVGDPQDPEGIMIYERRRKNHVWCWQWAEDVIEEDTSSTRSPLELIHKDQMLAAMREGLISKTDPYIDVQSEQITLYRPSSGDVTRWYNTDGNLWSIVQLCDEHLILRMNRALYSLVLPKPSSQA
jgi:hypothetical protein